MEQAPRVDEHCVVSKVRVRDISAPRHCPYSLSTGFLLHARVGYAEEVEAGESPKRQLVMY